MEEEVKLRMQLIMKEFDTNPTQLASQFGVNQKTLNSHINGDTSVSLSTILLILKAIPNLSAEWLLRGTGNMINSYNSSTDPISPSDKELVALSRDLVRVIGQLTAKINSEKEV